MRTIFASSWVDFRPVPLPWSTWAGVVELTLWLALAVAMFPHTLGAIEKLRRERELRWLILITTLAAALRCSVGFIPLNWYMGIDGLDSDVFTRVSTRQPLINLAAIVHAPHGISALNGLNVVLGTLSVFFLTSAVSTAGHPARVHRIFGVMLATIPLYVRVSASDGVYSTLLFLYSCGALAYARSALIQRTWHGFVILAVVPILAAPIRIESALLIASIPLVIYRIGRPLRSVVWTGAPSIVIGITTTIGGALCLLFFADTLQERLSSVGPFSVLLCLLASLSFIVNIAPVWFFTPLIALPILIVVVGNIRRSRWKSLGPTYLPVLFCSIPFAWTAGIGGDMVSTAYHSVRLIFFLIPCAVAIDQLWTRFSNREIIQKTAVRCMLVAAAVPAVLLSFVQPMTRSYAYQEEFGFLRENLPRGKATVLVVSDVGDDLSGDLDCCLSMPHPLLHAEFRELDWIVLRREDLREGGLRGLQFDYYYPGSMASTDPRLVRTWLPNRLALWLGFEGAMRGIRKQVEQLQSIHELDRRVRREYELVPYRSDVVPAHTFSTGRFRDDIMRLTIYRRVGGEGSAR